MLVEQLEANLEQAVEEGYGEYKLFFCDQDGECFSVDSCYLDDDADLCLEFNEDGRPLTVQQMYDKLDRYKDDTYAYFYNNAINLAFDIDDEEEDTDWDQMWYEDEGAIYLDVTYDEDSYEPENVQDED